MGLEKGAYEFASDLVDNNKGNINIDLGFLKKMSSLDKPGIRKNK